MTTDCKLNQVLGATKCVCGEVADCKTDGRGAKACVTVGSTDECLDVITAGYTNDPHDEMSKACAADSVDGTTVIYEPDKLCASGAIRAIPHCTGNTDCTARTAVGAGSSVCSVADKKYCRCGTDLLA